MKRIHFFLIALLAIHLLFLFNLRFTAWPEMLSYAYFRNNGFLLYKDMIHPYPPLLTMGLSYIYSIFGYGLWVLQSVAWATILVSDLLIFLITRQVTRNDKAALTSLAIYVFLQPFLEGNMLWFDIAIIPPVLLGTFFALRRKIFLAALSLSLAALVKQTAGIFLVFFFLFILIKRVKLREFVNFVAAPLILLLPLLIRLIQEGAMQDFLNWTLLYPLTEWGRYPGYVQMSITSRQLVILLLLVLPVLLLLLNERKTIMRRQSFSLVLLFFVASLLIVYPRFSFFHFQPALAFLVIIYGYMLNKVKWSTRFSIWHLAFIILAVFLIHRPVIARDWQEEARFYDSSDIEMAQTISAAVEPGERVFLLGLHSGLYAMGGRLPPERWTDNFGWYLETPGVQEEIISRWENPPRQLAGGGPPVAVFWQEPEPGNWFDLGTYQPQRIVEWIKENYTREKELKPGVWLWRLVLSEVEG